jgi:XRE family aerobic/anaerobic benzoate catabolism transcriptional regulator
MNQNDIARSIAAKVRASRAQVGLSRKRLAAIAGVSERYLGDLENGSANASIGILARIAHALEVDFASLLPGAGAAGAQHGNSPMRGQPVHEPLARLIGTMSLAEQQGALAPLETWLNDRRRTLKGIALLGLRGAGKTTIGGLYAYRHGLPFLSVTREIEQRAGMSLADLYNLGGANAYRALENEVVGDLAHRTDRIVLETAGGIVGNSEALDLVLRSFKSVWVKASPEEHLQRVIRQGDTRPMRGNPKALEHLKALLAAREAEYARAECVLDTTGRSPEDCVADLERIAEPVLAGHGG